MGSVSVRDFGARGDGAGPDTAAIQAAIDACARDRGGTVVVPAGTYLVATIFLRDGVTLHLEAQAVLLGTTDASRYHRCEFARYPVEFAGSLLYAEDASRIAITGSGAIDGQGSQFPHGMENFNAEEMGRSEQARSYSRPVLARFERCSGVILEGVTLRSAASMAVHFEGCSRVRVRGVTIDNRANQNTDGINLIGCRDVFVSDCGLSCGDDAIAIHQSGSRIVIANCVLSSRWAAIRIGPFSTGRFSDIAVSNCVIHDTYGSAIKLQMVEGGVMENLSFANLVMDHVTGPIAIRLAGWLGWRRERERSLPVGTLRDVRFAGIRATISDDAYPLAHEGPRNPGEARSCISITGLPGHPVCGISLSDVHLTFPGGGTDEKAARLDIPELPDAYPEYHMFGVLPAYGLYARHVRGLSLHDVRMQLQSPDGRPALLCDDVEELDLAELRAEGTGAGPHVRLRGTRGVSIRGCRAIGRDGGPLRVEGADGEGAPA